MKRKIYAILLTVMMATMTLTACGKDVSKMDDAELYAYLMDMNEDERENFIENLDSEQQYRAYSVLVVGEVTGASDDGNEQEDNSVKPDEGNSSGKKNAYAPTEEIINSTMSDAKVQIGNDVFQLGENITIGEFVDKYDNWTCDDLNLDEFGTSLWKFISKDDSTMSIFVYARFPEVEDIAHVKHSDMMFEAVYPVSEKAKENTWLAKGLQARNTGLTWETYAEYFEAYGLQYNDSLTQGNWFRAKEEGYSKDFSDEYTGICYVEYREGLIDTPMRIRYTMKENPKTGEIEEVSYELIIDD